jgi:hypothetical protein
LLLIWLQVGMASNIAGEQIQSYFMWVLLNMQLAGDRGLRQSPSPCKGTYVHYVAGATAYRLVQSCAPAAACAFAAASCS